MSAGAKTATAEKVLIEDDLCVTPTPPHGVFDEGMPPPTHAQIAYWRELCGSLSLAKVRGMTDDAWSADLKPSKPTLQALVERGIIVRRKRAWHLKRGWYTRITALQQRAVPTPRQSFAERAREDVPTYGELEGFEQICRWLDAQPFRRARLPFVGLREQLGAESEVPIASLKLMRKYRIARHTSTCEWALSPTWKARLLNLWKGVDREVRERFPQQPTPADPYVVAAGIDTWYLNRIDPAGLPLLLRHELDDLQAKASEDEEEVDTRWMYDGVPLRMYRTGVNTDQGGGVSWSYILRNPSLAVLIRKAPLGGIVAQARLGSECLWRLAPRRAMDELDALICRMWSRPIPFRQKSGKSDESARWQVSQIHLAVDVANAPLALEQASRYVSRSRSRAIYEAAKAEVEQLIRAIHSGEGEDPEPFAIDWDALYADDGYDAFDAFGDLGPDRDRDKEPEPVEERAVTIHGFGSRVSGMTFSPGADVSAVLYDKVLQARLSGKRHMEPIWAAAGWTPGVPVTRHEIRLRRRAVRELGLPRDLHSCLDDPWECLTHQKDLYGAVVGRAEACPDAVDVAWIRRVIPKEGDANQSRWPTDPVWTVVQSATFADASAVARRLIRCKQRGGEVKALDDMQYGCLASHVATLHPDGGQWTISRALGEVSGSLEAIEAKKAQAGQDFGELVRERRRQRGLPLPVAEKVLPFRVGLSHRAPEPGADLDDLNSTHGGVSELETIHPSRTEGRVETAWLELAEAEAHGVSERQMIELEQAFAHEVQLSGLLVASAGDEMRCAARCPAMGSPNESIQGAVE